MTEDEPPPTSTLVSRSIRIRVAIYLVIFLVMTVLVVVNAVGIGPDSLVPVLVLAGVGLVVGVVAARMYKLGWDGVNRQVVGRLDLVGGVVLVLYILFSIFRSRLAELWFAGPVAGVASLAALAGVMLGQAFGTTSGVRHILRILRGSEPG